MSARRSGALRIGALTVIALILSACGLEGPAAVPTPTPTDAGPILAASATVNPLLPTGDGNSSHRREQPHAGRAARGGRAGGGPASPTPRPTESFLPLMISAADGLILQATFYSGPTGSAPVAVLLHQEGGSRSDWEPLAQQLQAAGYAVLTLDLRGHGDTGGVVNWALVRDDVAAALALLFDLGGVDQARIVLVGAGVGANLALNACADTSGCAAAVLLSPGLDYHGITTADALARLGVRPLLIVAGDNAGNNPADSLTLDNMAQGAHQLVDPCWRARHGAVRHRPGPARPARDLDRGARPAGDIVGELVMEFRISRHAREEMARRDIPEDNSCASCGA